MSKELNEMSLEELWQLFPIYLVPPNEKWAGQYAEMEALLRGLLADYPQKRISHIGSTAIKGIWAKDTVDVLVELPAGSDMEKAAEALENGGLCLMSKSPGRMSFNSGYTKEGFADKVYHVHLRFAGDNDELYFRDYMNGHPQQAKEYEALKLNLWKDFEHDRDGYTEAKTEFIRKWTEEARRLYAGRY